MVERWGQWLDEGMDRSPWLGLARGLASVMIYQIVGTTIVYFGLALLGVDVGLA